MAAPAELCFAQRFCGPPGVANGGFGCGSLAALLDGAAEVTLRRPLPLERALTVRRDGDGLALTEGDMLLAEARPSAIDVALVVPADVTAEQARAAAGTARYYADPVFPDCFVCGPTRGPADGLRIFPGPVPGTAVYAAPWTPDPSVARPDGRVWPEVVWAALDCPSGSPPRGRPNWPPTPQPCLVGWRPTWPRCPTPATSAMWSPGRSDRRVANSPLARRFSARMARCSRRPRHCGSGFLVPVRHREPNPARDGGRGHKRTAEGHLNDHETPRGSADTDGDRPDIIVRTAELADELGYEVFAVPEGWGLDSTLMATEIALRTRRITVVSAILSVWGRTPGTLAMTAATLHRISEGRYILGLGVSTKALVEGFHDLPFVHPAAKLRDVTTKVRALLTGERARLDAASTARPLRLGQPPVPDLPIWLAATGERTIQVAAELADGWYPLFVARDRIASEGPELNRVRAATGLWRTPLTVAAGPMTVADDDADTARSVVASSTAWYLCAMGDVYAQVVANQGYGDAVQAIRAANPRPSPAHGIVPGDAQVILDQFTAYGTPRSGPRQLERWDVAVDILMIGLPPGLGWPAIEATLRAAAP